MNIKKPSISVIIPALNEADNLPQLLKSIACQKNVEVQTIVVDGGSKDNTLQQCEVFPEKYLIRLLPVLTSSGRGHQMNVGTEYCEHDDILFLHADSTILSETLFIEAHRHMETQRYHFNSNAIAGHFGLRFITSKASSHYYFYESKTRLNRPDCINGDQGFWISRQFLEQLGGFDESLPYMEDARLAAEIFKSGRWTTLPGTIGTSARRFEREGFKKRQILNSFLCNFNAMNVNYFFDHAVNVYKAQSESKPLNLKPFLVLAHRQFYEDGITTAIRRWYQTGSYIALNSWQLAFALDCKNNKKLGLEPGDGSFPWLSFFDAKLASIAQWPIVKIITGLLTILWFYSLFLSR